MSEVVEPIIKDFSCLRKDILKIYPENLRKDLVVVCRKTR